MDFSLLEVVADEKGEEWAERYFHKGHLRCPKCGIDRRSAWIEGQTKRSQIVKYRCRGCRKVYTVYHGTVFAHKQIRPGQVVLLLRGVCKGETTAGLARELEMSYDTVMGLRRVLQENAQAMQSQQPVKDRVTETDELFQNAGEKRRTARRSRGSASLSGEQTTRTWHL